MQMIQNNQFDTIYHEHFSYLSLTAVKQIFEHNGLNVFDVQEISTHGGSLRVFAQRNDTGTQPMNNAVAVLLNKEEVAGIKTSELYQDFQQRANNIKYDLTTFLIKTKHQGKKVMAYGAAAKGNTLLNYAGIRADLLPCVVDLNPAKKGKFLPGSRLPIVDEAIIKEYKPDYIVILPWNLREEVKAQLSYVREWGCKFVTAVPTLQVE
jgi:ABC-type Fe3+-hydroxamate transport system substrate-binding protein